MDKQIELLSIQFVEGMMPCQSCGTPIKWRYTVKLSTGALLIIGSECASEMLPKLKDERLATRARMATNQWRKKAPAPLEGESKADYINRRMAEMANAWPAWQECTTLLRGLDPMYGTLRCAAMRTLEKQHICYPSGFAHDPYGDNGRCKSGHRSDCPACQAISEKTRTYEQKVTETEQTLLAQVEGQCQANRFDFFGKAAFQVRKI